MGDHVWRGKSKAKRKKKKIEWGSEGGGPEQNKWNKKKGHRRCKKWREKRLVFMRYKKEHVTGNKNKWAKERLGEKKEANSAKRKEATSRRAQRHCDEHPIFGSNSSLVLKWFIFFFFFPLLTKKVIDFVSYSWDFFFFFFSLQKVGQCLFFYSLKRLIATSSERNVLLSFCGIIFVSPFFGFPNIIGSTVCFVLCSRSRSFAVVEECQ